MDRAGSGGGSQPAVRDRPKRAAGAGAAGPASGVQRLFGGALAGVLAGGSRKSSRHTDAVQHESSKRSRREESTR